MIGEFNLYGVFVPSLMLWAAAAVVLTALLRAGLRRAGAYRLVWHPALFDLAVFVIVLGCVITLAATWIAA
jgi:protein AaeX